MQFECIVILYLLDLDIVNLPPDEPERIVIIYPRQMLTLVPYYRYQGPRWTEPYLTELLGMSSLATISIRFEILSHLRIDARA